MVPVEKEWKFTEFAHSHKQAHKLEYHSMLLPYFVDAVFLGSSVHVQPNTANANM